MYCIVIITKIQLNIFLDGYVSEDHNNYTSSVSTSKSLSNFRCLDNSLSNCSYDVVDSCSESGGDLVIGCYNGNVIFEFSFIVWTHYMKKMAYEDHLWMLTLLSTLPMTTQI